MPISEATLRQVKYPPELIPDAWFGTLALNAEFAPPILDVRRLAGNLVALTNIQLTPNANVNLRARYDDSGLIEENTAAMLSTIPAAWVPAILPSMLPLPGAWHLPAKDRIYFNFFGLGVVANYTSHYGLWAVRPTVAHKILFGMPLTPDEQAIRDELGIADTVEKGLLPLPLNQQIEREYQVMGEETHTRSVNISAAAPTVFTIEVINPKPNEILVLTRVAASPAAAANNVQFIIDRDNLNLTSFPTFPLDLVAGGEISCFIPATKEIRLTASAAVAPGAHLFRYTIRRVKLNNILRIRFGLMSQAEAPGDLWKKVVAGVV
jgi:hypothetical protein